MRNLINSNAKYDANGNEIKKFVCQPLCVKHCAKCGKVFYSHGDETRKTCNEHEEK